eukprot:320854-Pleurochrysis_carterae.AAC.1
MQPLSTDAAHHLLKTPACQPDYPFGRLRTGLERLFSVSAERGDVSAERRSFARALAAERGAPESYVRRACACVGARATRVRACARLQLCPNAHVCAHRRVHVFTCR